MTTNDFSGAVLVLTDITNAAAIAQRVQEGWFPDSAYHYTVTESIPSGIPVDIADRAATTLRKAGGGASVLTVYPYEEPTLF